MDHNDTAFNEMAERVRINEITRHTRGGYKEVDEPMPCKLRQPSGICEVSVKYCDCLRDKCVDRDSADKT